jgi:glycosyltransferase involved in cell wall biosynthesis
MPSDAVVVAVMEEATVAAWMAQAQAPFPYIASLHTVESECLSDIYPDPSRLKAERWLFGAACEQAETITLPVDGCRDDLIRHFSVTNVKARVLANPVDCPRVRRQSFQTSKAVDNWKRGSSGFRMVHVGRLDPQKNHDLLLQACAELKRRNREFSLAIVGDGWFRAPVEKMIAELGLQNHVFLVGEQANPFPWIAASNALMLTSRFEAFGLVLVESMICGTPVVSVDCPVGPRAVLDGGDFGMLVAEGDAGAIASAVEQLIENPALCQQLTERGYQRALEFDVKTVVGLWEELLTTTTATKVG